MVRHQIGEGAHAGLVALVRERRVVGGRLGVVHARCRALEQLAAGQIRLRVGIGSPLLEALGHRTGAERRVHDEQPGEALGHRERQGQSEQTAPVLHHQHHVAQIQPLDELEHGVAMAVEAVPVVGVGLVRATEAEPVGRHHAHAGRREDRDHLAVEIAPARLTMQAQRRDRSVARAFVEVVHPHAIDVDIVRLEGEVGQALEPVVGSAQDVHAASRFTALRRRRPPPCHHRCTSSRRPSWRRDACPRSGHDRSVAARSRHRGGRPRSRHR